MGTLIDASPLDPWFVTGYTEGEGSFTYSWSGRQIVMYFGIRVGAPDRRLLEQVQRFFGGIGRIYAAKPTRASGPAVRRSRPPASYYRVNRLDELSEIVAHFDRYPLRGVRAGTYRIWREMVRLKADNFGRPPIERLRELATDLSSRTGRRM